MKFQGIDMHYEPISEKHDAAIAELIRKNLETHNLDIPGTVYFDDVLDHLSRYYNHPSRAYYVLMEHDAVIGGIGLAEFGGFKNCCELQKLYLSDAAKGRGMGYGMIKYLEEKAGEMRYTQVYLETHTNLKAAIHIYEKSGYKEIERPENVVHSTMNRFYLKTL